MRPTHACRQAGANALHPHDREDPTLTLLHEACFLEDEDASLDIAHQVSPPHPHPHPAPAAGAPPPPPPFCQRPCAFLFFSFRYLARLAAQLVSNGVSTDATSTLFPLPFTAFDVACCTGKESVCSMLVGVQSGADWWKGSLDLVTSQASAVAEYVQDQAKHKRCVQLLMWCKALARVKSLLYQSVEQGDEKQVRTLLEQVSISDDALTRNQLMTLAIKNNNLQVLALLQAFGKVNTPAHLQHALLQLGRVAQSEEDGITETLLAQAMPLLAEAQTLVKSGVVLREPKNGRDETARLCLESFLSGLCATESKHIFIVVHLLLEARVDPDAARVRDPRAPLVQACLHAETATVKLLLDAKASADTPAIRVTFGRSDIVINATPLVATILRGDSGSATKLVLDALRWRVSKTGLASLVSMAPSVRKLQLVCPPPHALSSRHASRCACFLCADHHRGLLSRLRALAQAERHAAISRARQGPGADGGAARAA